MTALQTSYKYINFTQIGDVWVCRNNQSDVVLCDIEYYARWRQWEMCEVNPAAGFTADCLRDILHFMAQLKVLK